MNTPTGFRIVDGEVTDVDPWAAMFNDGVWLQFAHMWVAAFMVVGFVRRRRVRRRHAARAPRRAPPARLHRAVRVRHGRRAGCSRSIGHVLGMRLGDRRSRRSWRRSSSPRRPSSPHRCGSAALLIDGEVRGGASRSRARARSSPAAPSTKPVPGLDTFPAGRPAAGQHHARGVPVDGRHRHAAGARRRRSSGSPAGAAATCSATAGSCGSRSSAGPLAVVALEARLDRHRGRPPAVDRLRRPAHRRRRRRQLRACGGPARRMPWSTPAMTIGAYVVLRSMARRWRAGEEDLPSPYGPEAAHGRTPGGGGR